MAAKAFVIKDSNGNVIGRCIPRKDSSKGVATTFFKFSEGLLVRTYGHEDEHWRNALTIRLFEMNQKFGCETHIQNFADLCV